MILTPLQPLMGELCWDVEYDRQLGLWLKFGKPVLKLDELKPQTVYLPQDQTIEVPARYLQVKGVWELHCCVADWKVTLAGVVTARSSSSWRQVRRGTWPLEGQRLVKAEVDDRTGATVFTFDLGAELSLRRRRGFEPDDHLWILFGPDDRLFEVRPDGTCRSGHKSDDTYHWDDERPIREFGQQTS